MAAALGGFRACRCLWRSVLLTLCGSPPYPISSGWWWILWLPKEYHHGRFTLTHPIPFLRNRRTLRALLIDDQVCFFLSDFCRVTGYTHEDRLAMHMADDQIRQERLLTEDGLELDLHIAS
ncbi:hypothetical protein P3W53_22100 [Pseudomonas denitrificans (nom. rej.)]|nr:hypothetical protein [Pseudomonas denitrificans (nom. rej.)]